jgi:hypothetical protein
MPAALRPMRIAQRAAAVQDDPEEDDPQGAGEIPGHFFSSGSFSSSSGLTHMLR